MLCPSPPTQLTNLTALALSTKIPSGVPVPDVLSCLTGLERLRISHGLTQVCGVSGAGVEVGWGEGLL